MLKVKYPKYVKRFQKKGVRKMNHFRGRVLLADEMRLGKTLQTLFYCKGYPKQRPIIVVCPATVKYVWQYQAWEHTKIRATVLEGRSPSKNSLDHKEEMIILNFEILEAWMPYILKLCKDSKYKAILVIDESHYIKNRSAKRNKNVKKMSKKFKKIIAISGTPLVNAPAELWPTLNLVRPDLFPNFLTFALRYCKPTYRYGRWEYKGAEHLDELHRILHSTLMVRRLRKDVLKHYKEPSRVIIPLDIERRKEYEEAENNFITWLSKKSKNKAASAAKAARLVQMGYLARLSAELKMKAVEQWLDDFLASTDEKILLCAIHKKIVKRLHDKYKKISVVVDGSVTGKKRDLAIRSFQKNKRIRMFIGNIKAAGVGIDLSSSNTIAFIELDWVPGNHTQFEDRVVHINKKKAVDIVYLVAKGTIEEKRCKILQKKQRILSSTLDGSADINTLNIYDELEKSLKRKGDFK